MKVDKVIFSSDDSHYLDFWKTTSEVTLKKLGITPVLFHITDEDSDFYEDEFGLIKKIKRLPNYSDKIQAQSVRMYGTKYFQDEVCLISDIDMLLFNKEYLDKNLNGVDDEDIVILNSDAYDPIRPECVGIHSGPDRYPICYIIAKGKIFDKILGTDIPFDSYMDKVESVGFEGDNDEIYFGRCVNRNEEITVHKIKRGYCSNFYVPNRIEKNIFDNNYYHYHLNLNGYVDLSLYIDCHCKGPYSQYKHLIDKIKDQILND